MDLVAEIERIYGQLSDDRVDMAVMSCVRLARYRGGLMNVARFLRVLMALGGYDPINDR
jgi:hypothetical protein